MTRSIDLMPEAARRRLGHLRQVRRCAMLYAANVVLLTALTLGFGFARDAAQRRVAQLQKRVELDAEQREQATKLRERISSIEAHIARHDRLAWPAPLGDVIAVIGEVMPDPVALTSLNITPREENSRRSARSRSNEQTPQRRQGQVVIELQGLAAGDREIADFVDGLDDHSLFASVAVDYARRGEVRGVEARVFGLTCEIELNKDYVFADRTAEDGA